MIDYFEAQKPNIDTTDGISLEFNNWRLNLRQSNTEPVIRLNLEVNGQKTSIKAIIDEVESIIIAKHI